SEAVRAGAAQRQIRLEQLDRRRRSPERKRVGASAMMRTPRPTKEKLALRQAWYSQRRWDPGSSLRSVRGSRFGKAACNEVVRGQRCESRRVVAGRAGWHPPCQTRHRVEKESPPCGGLRKGKGAGYTRAILGARPAGRRLRRRSLRHPASAVRISLCDSGMTFWQSRAQSARAKTSLDLAFLVDHVLADDGVVFLDLHLVRRVLLVLVGGVEVA